MKDRYAPFSVLAGTIACAGLAVSIGLAMLDELAGTISERYMSEITGTPVKIDEIQLDIIRGQAQLQDVRISNPEHFGKDDVMRLGQVRVVLDIEAIVSGQLRLKEVEVNDPLLNYQTYAGTSNLDVIAEHAKRYADAKRGLIVANDDVPRLMIDKLLINRGKVRTGIDMGAGERLSLELPDVHLHTPVPNGQGLATEDVNGQILGSIKSAVGVAIASWSLGVSP